MLSVQALLNQRDPVNSEQRSDEVCLGIYPRDQFDEIHWETARMGQQPYDADGRQTPRSTDAFFPVFIKRAELLDPRGIAEAKVGLLV